MKSGGRVLLFFRPKRREHALYVPELTTSLARHCYYFPFVAPARDKEVGGAFAIQILCGMNAPRIFFFNSQRQQLAYRTRMHFDFLAQQTDSPPARVAVHNKET